MDLKQIRALIAIVEHGSVTRAAEQLHIVQPAVSRQIRLLEDELGIRLFERERHGMELTEAGRILVDHGRRALEELDTARARLSRQRQAVTGEVTIGFLPSAADFLASALMSRVREEFPGITLRSSIAYADDVEQALARGLVDLALLYLRGTRAFEGEELVEEELFIVGPPSTGLTLDGPVEPALLGDWTMVLPPFPNGLRMMTEQLCLQAGVRLGKVREAGTIALQKSLVQAEAGLTLLPGLCLVDELAAGSLSAAPVGKGGLRRRLLLARTPARPATLATRKVEETLRAILRDRVLAGQWPGAEWLGGA